MALQNLYPAFRYQYSDGMRVKSAVPAPIRIGAYPLYRGSEPPADHEKYQKQGQPNLEIRYRYVDSAKFGTAVQISLKPSQMLVVKSAPPLRSTGSGEHQVFPCTRCTGQNKAKAGPAVGQEILQGDEFTHVQHFGLGPTADNGETGPARLIQLCCVYRRRARASLSIR
eukprot:496081-Rhodomonas_salina.1